MKDNEIIKAFGSLYKKLLDVKYDLKITAKEFKALNSVNALLNRQKAEIERLQQKNSELESDLILKTYDYEHLLMKCKELQAISSSRKDRLMQTVVKLQTAKSEARKEFVKRFIKDLSHMITYDKDYIKAKANKLLEEMESESDV